MRIGTICFSSLTGLGYQSRQFAQHMNVDKILIDDLSAHNGMPVDHTWASNARTVQHNDLVRNNDWSVNEHIEWLTDDIDVLVIHETPLNHGLYVRAKEKNVKTIQVTNYEFIDGYNHPDWPRPDYIGMPTTWKNHEAISLNMGEVISWPVPVDRTLFPYTPRKTLKTFIHVIGRPTYLDRNGTLTFLEATKILGDKYNYKVFLQPPKDPRAAEHFLEVQQALNDNHLIELITDVEDPKTIYDQGDVLVLPRRYGGLCLPMQEALSSGLPVIMTDIPPNRDRLPPHWLIPAQYQNEFFFHAPIDVYTSNPQDLANTMESFANTNALHIASEQANQIANTLSWEILKPYYQETLEQICNL